MTNLLKEIGRRATLVDLVQDVEEINKFLEPLDEGRMKTSYKLRGYFRTATRGALRAGGYSALIYGIQQAQETQNNMHIGWGIAMCVFTFIMDYYGLERLVPAYWKEDDPR